MIYAVPSELRTNSLCLKYKGAHTLIPLPGLEALTGADLMITPDDDQETNELLFDLEADDAILLAISHGAILIQLKFGHDLSSSIHDGRIREAHMRMCMAGARPNQRWLMFVGLAHPDAEGKLLINGSPSYHSYLRFSAYISVSMGWSLRGTPEYGFGGIICEVSNNNYFALYLEKAQHYANAIYEGEVKAVSMHTKSDFNSDNMFGQVIREIPKICHVWASIDGIGEKRALQLYDIAVERGKVPSMDFFIREVIYKEGKYIPGFGKGIAQKAKNLLFPELSDDN